MSNSLQHFTSFSQPENIFNILDDFNDDFDQTSSDDEFTPTILNPSFCSLCLITHSCGYCWAEVKPSDNQLPSLPW